MITVTDNEKDPYHHMPQNSGSSSLQGLSLRRALKTLRGINFGNIGGTNCIALSDGSYIKVELEPRGNSQLMNSQRVRRFSLDGGEVKFIRYYSI